MIALIVVHARKRGLRVLISTHRREILQRKRIELGWSVPEAVGLLPHKHGVAGHNNNEGKETLRSQEKQEDVHYETGT